MEINIFVLAAYNTGHYRIPTRTDKLTITVTKMWGTSVYEEGLFKVVSS